jgi:pSer/pThr/pTyr-binding forkhead associated (FHA) protein
LISVASDGSLIYRDLGSSNGTKLNGAEVASLVDLPLKSGDQLTLGHWTRITVEPNF